jgi:hypothetical protein
MKRTMFLLLTAAIATGLFFACDESDNENSSESSEVEADGTVSEKLNDASNYVDVTIPDMLSGTRSSASTRSNGTIEFINAGKWASASSDDLITPPGGVPQASETLVCDGYSVSGKVNYRDYVKIHLDSSCKMTQANGSGFKPTIYGRFDSLIQIMTYIQDSGIPTDDNGIPDLGIHTGQVTIDMGTLTILMDVEAAQDTTYYDKRMTVTGFADTNANNLQDSDEPVLIDVLMWLRFTGTEFNFMNVDVGDYDNDNANESFSISVLKWELDTGKMAFEYVSDTSDSVTNGNLSHYRLLIEAENSKSWLYIFDGKASTGDSSDFIQWALYTPDNSSEKGTVSIRQLRADTSDVWLGNICAKFATGEGEPGPEPITGDTSSASGGTCQGHVSDSLNIKTGMMDALTKIRVNTTYLETAEDKGFPGSADYTASSSDKSAWLSAGDLVSVSFSNRGSFIDNFDKQP